MIKRELRVTNKNYAKDTRVTFANDPIIFENMINSIKSNSLKRAYEIGLIRLHQDCSESFYKEDYVIINKWNDSLAGDVILIYCEDSNTAFITTRPSVVEVVLTLLPDPRKKIRVGRVRKSGEPFLIITDETGRKAKVCKSSSDDDDIEKATLYAVCKLHGIPREEIMEYLYMVRNEIGFAENIEQYLRIAESKNAPLSIKIDTDAGDRLTD